MKKWAAYPVLILAAGMLCYSNSFSGVFLLDDFHAIVENGHIRRLWDLERVLFPGYGSLSLRPLVNFTFAVNYAIGGLNPFGYHLANLGIHLSAGLVLFALIRRSASTGLAFAAAILWVVHPLQTQAVVYLVQRSESLMALFYLLTFYAVCRLHSSAHPHRWTAAAVLFCFLGMMAKQVMVTAPVLVFLYDRIFFSKSIREVFRKRRFLYPGLAATWLPLLPFVKTLFDSSGEKTLGFGFQSVTPLEYALTQAGVLLHYLKLVVWPHPLVFDYAWPFVDSFQAALPACAAVLFLIAGSVMVLWKKPAAGFLMTAFFVILLPTSSVIPIADAAFEHRMYLPSAALLTLLVVITSKILRNRIAAGSLLAACVLLLGSLTFQRNFDYTSEYRIWKDTAQKRPQNPRAYNTLGKIHAQRGEIETAVALFEAALQADPDYAKAHSNLGNALSMQRKFEQAFEHYRRAEVLTPDFPDVFNNFGYALLLAGKSEEALSKFKRALELNPNQPPVLNNMGNALAAQEQYDLAVPFYEQALKINPDLWDVRFNLAEAYFNQGKVEEAAAEYRNVLRLNPAWDPARQRLKGSDPSGATSIEQEKRRTDVRAAAHV